MSKAKFKIITSWDDGYLLDLKLAKMLAKYNLPAIFFVPKKNPERKTLNSNQIKQLARRFEIGAHTLNHVDLTNISLKEAKEEIEGSKKWLEDLLKKRITKFCYPKGKFNAETKLLVKEAGFTYAKTVRCFEIHPEQFDPFKQPVTVKVGKWRKSLIKRLWSEKYYLNLNVLAYCARRLDWLDLAKIYLNLANKSNGVFHIWGHSWEIEKEKNWETLESLFKILKQWGARK